MFCLVQVPSTSEAVDGKGVYTVFNIHLNGHYHGSVRYSQLLALQQEVNVHFDVSHLAEFPGKHWFNANPEKLLTRRLALERYLHSLSQNKLISNSELVTEFFVALQKFSMEPSLGGDGVVPLEVFLLNGKSVTVLVNRYQRTDQVLEGVASHIQLAPACTYLFNLFLEKQEGSGQTWTVLRPLTNYECPCLSLSLLTKSTMSHRIIIRKHFWDHMFVPELLNDRVARNLLYLESLHSVSNNHWDMPSQTRSQLHAMEKASHKREHVELAASLPQYGFTQCDGFVVDHPEDLSNVSVRVGKLELVTYMACATNGGLAVSGDDGAYGNEGDFTKVFTYSLTRIKSWKVGGKWNVPDQSWKLAWLKFIYQVGPGQFTCITMQGPHAIFLSNCLHAIVDELVRIRSSQDVRRPSEAGIKRELRELHQVIFNEPPQIQPEGEGDRASVPSQASPISHNSQANTKQQPSHAQPCSNSTTKMEVSSSCEQEQSTRPVKTKHCRVAKMKKEAGDSGNMENPTFQFGTDDDL